MIFIDQTISNFMLYCIYKELTQRKKSRSKDQFRRKLGFLRLESTKLGFLKLASTKKNKETFLLQLFEVCNFAFVTEEIPELHNPALCYFDIISASLALEVRGRSLC